jgi:hypothetical protein
MLCLIKIIAWSRGCQGNLSSNTNPRFPFLRFNRNLKDDVMVVTLGNMTPMKIVI